MSTPENEDSVQTDLLHRSAKAFARGAWKGVRNGYLEEVVPATAPADESRRISGQHLRVDDPQEGRYRRG